MLDSIKNNKNVEKLTYLLILMLTGLVYSQVGSHQFINFDDYQYVIQNPNINKGLSWESFWWAFTESDFANWHPLTWISHMLDVELFGLDAGWHHLVSLCLHLSNTGLLLFLLHRLTHNFWPSALVAALFAIHPAHVESVAWVAERKDVLSTFFFLATLIFYNAFVQHKNIKNYLLVMLMLVFGLMSKPMVVTLPFVMLLMDYWPLRRITLNQTNKLSTIKLLVLEKIPFFLLILMSGLITYYVQQDFGAMSAGDKLELSVRLENAIVSYARYIGIAIYPENLTVFYPHPGKWPTSFIVLSALLLVGISIFSLFFLKKFPYIAIGWFFFLGTLVPVIGIVQVGAQSIADRYTYIPFIGLFIIFSWGIRDCIHSFEKLKTVLVGSVITIVALFSFLAWNYLTYWKYDGRLFRHVLEVHDPGYAEVLQNKRPVRAVPLGLYSIYTNLGLSLYEVGLYAEAEIHLREAIRLHPSHFKPYHILAMLKIEQKEYKFAQALLTKAVELYPEGEKEFEVLLQFIGNKIDEH